MDNPDVQKQFDGKRCYKCKTRKPLEDFYTNNRLPDKKDNRCKSCARSYRDSRKEELAGWHLERTYGITLEDYDEMYKQQNGCCAICGSTETGGKGDRFRVDHCHTTNEVRGLLCHNCNLGLGYFKDNATSLANAIAYLEDNNG